MKDYKAYINQLASSKSTDSFVNSGADHASVVLSTLFKHANKTVYLFSGNLNGAVSDDKEYRNELLKFLTRGGELKILLESYNEDLEPKIFKILRLAKNLGFKVQIKKHRATMHDSNSNKKIHFAVSDTNAYRLENDTVKYLATGSFNDSENAEYLIKIFDKIFGSEKSKEIKLT